MPRPHRASGDEETVSVDGPQSYRGLWRVAGRYVSAGRERSPGRDEARTETQTMLSFGARFGERMRRPVAREALIFAGFVVLTALMTWPWVMNLRDAVADVGDPYMISWSLWWDYHQTFTDPLRLFHGNVFYPYQYTLAFSENDYGIALLFFPLFAMGVRPLTVNSLATFLGFAFCGYASFRLTRTLTGSVGAGIVAGIFFAFVPFRFALLSHLHYLFAGWLPLVLEALVLYCRRQTWRRAAWLGTAFLMNALTCISWFVMALIPLLLTGCYLLARSPSLMRARAFWLRAGVALTVAGLMLLPFLLPYIWVSELYGLRWQSWEYHFNSPHITRWLSAEPRNKLWAGFGQQSDSNHRMFPGLLAPLLALAAMRLTGRGNEGVNKTRRRVINALNALMLPAALIGIFAIGFPGFTIRVFGQQILRAGGATPFHALMTMVVLMTVRVLLSLPSFIERLRERRAFGVIRRWWRDEALAVGLIWAVWGWLSSLGAGFFLGRWLHDHVVLFQSLRIPARWAMICYVGLAVLAGVGAMRLATLCAARRWTLGSRLRRQRITAVVCVILCAALLFELRAFPLDIVKGEADPDALALRLKETPMRGGLVELPSDVGVLRHRYMLRAADHGRPLVNAHASFLSPLTHEINEATKPGRLNYDFITLLENIPASYLVIHTADVPAERRLEYEKFLEKGLVSGRLRFVNQFDKGAQLYAVTAIEPEAVTEAPLPFDFDSRDWDARVADDPVHLLGANTRWSMRLLRLRIAATGELPRYSQLMEDAREVGRGIGPILEESDEQFTANLRGLAAKIVAEQSFQREYAALDDAEFVERLFTRAGLPADVKERERAARSLAAGEETREGLLARVAADERMEADWRNRALVALYFYGYLRRSPAEPPDDNLGGLLHWVGQLERGMRHEDLGLVFESSLEHQALKKK